MLKLFVIPQLQHIPNIIFQLDCSPRHWSLDVWNCLDRIFTERGQLVLHNCTFRFLRLQDFIKHKVYQPKIRSNELRKK